MERLQETLHLICLGSGVRLYYRDNRTGRETIQNIEINFQMTLTCVDINYYCILSSYLNPSRTKYETGGLNE